MIALSVAAIYAAKVALQNTWPYTALNETKEGITGDEKKQP